ncbi:hypothetical protein QL285_069807 [Trifolium repens]|nr:hypothetical protein QL285_069807 [Trifolium repens]
MQNYRNLNNASEALARSLWIRTHSRHLECELLLDDRLVHLPDRSQLLRSFLIPTGHYRFKRHYGLKVTLSSEGTYIIKGTMFLRPFLISKGHFTE